MLGTKGCTLEHVCSKFSILYILHIYGDKLEKETFQNLFINITKHIYNENPDVFDIKSPYCDAGGKQLRN